MTALVFVVVVAGIALVVATAASGGIDAVTAVLLGLIVAVGALALAVIRRLQSGFVQPARCRECGGLVSANAPYCKHCGALAHEAPEGFT